MHASKIGKFEDRIFFPILFGLIFEAQGLMKPTSKRVHESKIPNWQISRDRILLTVMAAVTAIGHRLLASP